MPHVEDDTNIRASVYSRPLSYTFDSSLRSGQGAFRYMFSQGALNCHHLAQQDGRICMVSRNEQSTIGRDRPSFVYLDCGCWVDNSDGNNTQRRDFGLVCGPHVYLCEFTGTTTVPTSRVPSVQRLFSDMAGQNCGLRVLSYVHATPPMASTTPTDQTLYLFLGDLHLPPVSWFYTTPELVGLSTGMVRTPPTWLINSAAMQRQPNHLMRNYYSLAQYHRERNNERVARGPVSGNPDIFRMAGTDLVRFIDGLANTSQETKNLLHFIQTGDMMEMWVGRDYQFQDRNGAVVWLNAQSENLTSDWALEILIQNTPVFEALRRLQAAGLSETKFLWGNHDAYMKMRGVTQQVTLPERDPVYTGLSDDLYAEHGHRFDSSNFDEVEDGLTSGPALTNLTFWVPVVRSMEPWARGILTVTGDPAFRDVTMLGATLIYLSQRYDRQVNPFSIYVIGHTHARMLHTFNIRTQYQLHG